MTALQPDDGSPVIITGQIDRIDRLPSGGIEVIDYRDRPRLIPEGHGRRPLDACRGLRGGAS